MVKGVGSLHAQNVVDSKFQHAVFLIHVVTATKSLLLVAQRVIGKDKSFIDLVARKRT
jgi:hypothetical protein